MTPRAHRSLDAHQYRLGTKGNKIDTELAPMAEGQLEAGQIPGDSPATTVAADGFVSSVLFTACVLTPSCVGVWITVSI
jgi:hypothetical protein